jgi:hypothetical protein
MIKSSLDCSMTAFWLCASTSTTNQFFYLSETLRACPLTSWLVNSLTKKVELLRRWIFTISSFNMNFLFFENLAGLRLIILVSSDQLIVHYEGPIKVRSFDWFNTKINLKNSNLNFFLKKSLNIHHKTNSLVYHYDMNKSTT